MADPVTIRITRVEKGQRITFRVDGRLVGEDVGELLRLCEELREPKTLDLGGVQFVDDQGVRALRDLRARGFTLLGASPYVRLLLGQPATDDDMS